MSAFNFTDFVIYSNITNADSASFATIARGVIGLVKSIYGIQVDPGETIIQNTYITESSDATLIYIEKAPIVSVTSVTHNGVALSYTLTEQTLSVDTTLVTDYTLPVIVTLVVGYTNVPDDLKFAIYRHIEAVYFDVENNVDNVSKSINSVGNTIFYRDSIIPAFSKSIYDWYSRRQIVLY